VSGGAGPLVRYDRDGAVARITLDRPEKLNAFNDQMVRELAATLRRFDLDAGARAAVLIGAGRAFSAGADVRERQGRPAEELAALASPEAWDADSTQLMTRAVHWKPVVAAVHGYVLGMAVGLAVECELIVAAQDVKFQVTETVRGLSPTRYWELLCWRTSEGFATRAALQAPYIEADEALDARLVQQCVAPGELWGAAARMAGRLAELPPGGVRAMVRARRHRIREINELCRYDNELHKLHLTGDFSASVAGFLAKPPGESEA
jgi:enoyl-CoA hydratase/carnithine racemase